MAPPTSFSFNAHKPPQQLRQVLSGSSHNVLRDELKRMLQRDFISLHVPLKWQKRRLSVLHQHNFLRSIYAWKGMFLLITCFIEYFDVRWIEMRPPCEKTTVTNWVPWGYRVRATASGGRASVVSRVAGYVDIMTTPISKSGSIRITSVHCTLLILVLCQLYGIVSFDVIEREDESFTSVGMTCARTSWNGRTMWSHVKKLEENINPLRKGRSSFSIMS